MRRHAFGFTITDTKLTFSQKIGELACRKMNIVKNGTIDLEAAQRLFNESDHDATWKQIFKNSIDYCQFEVVQNAEKFQASSTIPEDRCNVSFDFFLDCVHITSFSVRTFT